MRLSLKCSDPPPARGREAGLELSEKYPRYTQEVSGAKIFTMSIDFNWRVMAVDVVDVGRTVCEGRTGWVEISNWTLDFTENIF